MFRRQVQFWNPFKRSVCRSSLPELKGTSSPRSPALFISCLYVRGKKEECPFAPSNSLWKLQEIIHCEQFPFCSVMSLTDNCNACQCQRNAITNRSWLMPENAGHISNGRSRTCIKAIRILILYCKCLVQGHSYLYSFMVRQGSAGCIMGKLVRGSRHLASYLGSIFDAANHFGWTRRIFLSLLPLPSCLVDIL